MRNFRNYDRFELPEIGPLTILVGPNAVGKTTVVEAVQLVTALKSFRTNQAAQLVKWGAESAQVQAQLRSASRQLDVQLRVVGSRRAYVQNGKTRRMSQLAGQLPAVTFTPDDLHLAKGPASARRAALDDLGMQVSPNFRAVRSDYAKLLRQKNQALRDEAPDDYLASIDDVLVRVAAQVTAHRATLAQKLQPHFARAYERISAGAEPAQLRYTPCWLRHDPPAFYEHDRAAAMDALQQSVRAHAQAERAARRSLVGPHADDVTFLLSGRDSVNFASQGQQRSLVLAFKLAELAVVQELLDQRPILLLDDVMSELDAGRRAEFTQVIGQNIQTIITTTTLEYFTPQTLATARVVELGARHGTTA